MPEKHDPQRLEWQWRMDELCDEFELQVRAGRCPRIEDFLDRVSEPHRANLRSGLLEIQRELASAAASKTEMGGTISEYRYGPASHNSHRQVEELLREGTNVGVYTLIGRLGEGAFGEVWRGQRIGRLATTDVAIKIPRSNAVSASMIRQEAQSWVRASGHPNVVPIIEADIYDGVVGIVSEFIDGGTLSDHLQRHGRFEPFDAVEIMIGILTGLEHLHARKIIHRDLKPANIMIQQGIPRLADFGLSGVEAPGHIVAGTPAYMSLEALAGKCSTATDLWSTGVILYQLLTGTVPFGSGSVDSVMRALNQEQFLQCPADVPSLIRRVVEKTLNKDAEMRFQTAAEMRAALSECRRRIAQGDNPDRPRHMTVCVTGSMHASQDVVRSRLKPFLSPHQAVLTTWYTGSHGVVDEQAAELLATSGQQLYLVGYTENDVSPAARQLMQTFDLPFIDAQNENVPPESGAPSQRDIFFATKADLVILVWDGASIGTRQLYRWLVRHRRDHQLIYI